MAMDVKEWQGCQGKECDVKNWEKMLQNDKKSRNTEDWESTLSHDKGRQETIKECEHQNYVWQSNSDPWNYDWHWCHLTVIHGAITYSDAI